jgi:hypothetical protein
METASSVISIECGVKEWFLILSGSPVFCHRDILLIRIFKDFELDLHLIRVSESLSIFLNYSQ